MSSQNGGGRQPSPNEGHYPEHGRHVFWSIPAPPEHVYDEGACVGMPQSWWFEERAETQRRAKEICQTCPVIDDCFKYAINLSDSDDHGVWGGTSREERKRIRNAGRR